MPKNPGVIIYSDVKANFPQTHAAISTVLSGLTMMLNAQGGENKLFIDMTKFPPPEAFMKHLFGSVMVVKSEKEQNQPPDGLLVQRKPISDSL